MSDEEQSVIIDTGSGYIKTGFSGENNPKVVLPTVIESPDASELKYPVERGIIKDWEGMEKIWDHCFKNELKCNPSEYNILLSDSPINPKENREKMAEIMFGKFQAKGLFIANQAVLSLCSAGRFTGMVCDSGDGISQFVPIWNGIALNDLAIKSDIAGGDITKYFFKLLPEAGIQIKTSEELRSADDIKEKLCYVALNPEEEKNNIKTAKYELPDGKVIIAKEQSFMAPEALFNPSLAGINQPGLGQMCFDAIMKTDMDQRRDFYENLFLFGGNSMLRGFTERFQKEITEKAPEAIRMYISVTAKDERQYSVYIGGTILPKFPPGAKNLITKKEYDESGASVIHRKFICSLL